MQCAGVTLWFVGLPRRKSSLSMEGRSSWMSDMVCSISIAHAVGMACAMFPPTASHAARQRHGRTRLPPASSEYLRANRPPGLRGLTGPACNPEHATPEVVLIGPPNTPRVQGFGRPRL